MKKNFWVLAGLAVVSCLYLGSVGCEHSRPIQVVDASKEAESVKEVDEDAPLNGDEGDAIVPEEETPATPPTEPVSIAPNGPAPTPLPPSLPAPDPAPLTPPQPAPVLPSQPASVAETPHVTSVTPSGSGNFISTMVAITFNEPMDKASVTEAFAIVILPTDGDGATCFNGGKWEKTYVNDSGTEFTLLFTQPLEGCTFTGIVSGRVKSREGIAMGADYTWTFALKDETASRP